MNRLVRSTCPIFMIVLLMGLLGLAFDVSPTHQATAQNTPLITSIAWNPDGQQVAVGYSSGQLEVRNATGQLVSNLVGHSLSVDAIAWHPISNQLASGGAGELFVWNGTNGQILQSLGSQVSVFAYVSSVSWNRDATRLIAFSNDAPNALVWDTSNYHLLTESYDTQIGEISWSIDRNHVVGSTTAGGIDIRDPLTFLGGADALEEGAYVAALSPGAQRIVTGSWRNAIRIWNVPSGGAQSVSTPDIVLNRLLRVESSGPNFPSTYTVAISFSLSGNRVYSVSGSGEFAVWNANSSDQTPISTSQLPGAPITAAAFNQLGTKLAYGDSAGTLHIVDVSTLIANETLATPLALFRPSDGQANLINLPPNASPNTPTADNFITYGTGAPSSTNGGQWVMGDWDGDGAETPGVYVTSGGDAGKFFHTNTLGPSSSWTATWFGLFAGVDGNHPVAGKFSRAAHDCIGVTDSANFPPYGTAFALYFTCDMAGGNPAKTNQWLSVLLPDEQTFSGTRQFGAGDFDGDGIETVAMRRGANITWTNTPPNQVNATFPDAQFWGTPTGASGEGSLAVGDWDSNGQSSFGVYYPANGNFIHLNELTWDTGAYQTQVVGSPLGTTGISATSWRLR